MFANTQYGATLGQFGEYLPRTLQLSQQQSPLTSQTAFYVPQTSGAEQTVSALSSSTQLSQTSASAVQQPQSAAGQQDTSALMAYAHQMDPQELQQRLYGMQPNVIAMPFGTPYSPIPRTIPRYQPMLPYSQNFQQPSFVDHFYQQPQGTNGRQLMDVSSAQPMFYDRLGAQPQTQPQVQPLEAAQVAAQPAVPSMGAGGGGGDGAPPGQPPGGGGGGGGGGGPPGPPGAGGAAGAQPPVVPDGMNMSIADLYRAMQKGRSRLEQRSIELSPDKARKEKPIEASASWMQIKQTISMLLNSYGLLHTITKPPSLLALPVSAADVMAKGGMLGIPMSFEQVAKDRGEEAQIQYKEYVFAFILVSRLLENNAAATSVLARVPNPNITEAMRQLMLQFESTNEATAASAQAAYENWKYRKTEHPRDAAARLDFIVLEMIRTGVPEPADQSKKYKFLTSFAPPSENDGLMYITLNRSSPTYRDAVEQATTIFEVRNPNRHPNAPHAGAHRYASAMNAEASDAGKRSSGGGKCFECGSTKHKKKDCPKLKGSSSSSQGKFSKKQNSGGGKGYNKSKAKSNTNVCGWCKWPGHKESDCRHKANGTPKYTGPPRVFKKKENSSASAVAEQEETNVAAHLDELTPWINELALNTGSDDETESKQSSHEVNHTSPSSPPQTPSNNLRRGVPIRFIYDTGASRPMVNSSVKLYNLQDSKTNIDTANTGSSLKATRGEVLLFTEEGIPVKLNNVLQASELRNNLMDSNSIMKAVGGTRVVVREGGFDVVDEKGTVLLSGSQMRNIFWFTLWVAPPPPAEMAMMTLQQLSDTGHQRVAHLGHAMMHELLKHKLIKAKWLKSSSSGTVLKQFCHDCAQGKAKRKSFVEKVPEVYQARRPLERIDMDLNGPLPLSHEGYEYLLGMIDRFSHYMWFYPLVSKSDAADKIMSLCKKLKSKYGTWPACLHADQGGEFMSLELAEFCDKQGITQQFAEPETPEHNGAAERLWGVNFPLARACLVGSKGPVYLWSELFTLYLMHTVNRTLVVKEHNRTPYQLLNNTTEALHLDYLLPFGCDLYVTLRPQQRENKLTPAAVLGVFVGYTVNGGYYVMRTDGSMTVYETKHATALPDSFTGMQLLKRNASSELKDEDPSLPSYWDEYSEKNLDVLNRQIREMAEWQEEKYPSPPLMSEQEIESKYDGDQSSGGAESPLKQPSLSLAPPMSRELKGLGRDISNFPTGGVKPSVEAGPQKRSLRGRTIKPPSQYGMVDPRDVVAFSHNAESSYEESDKESYEYDTDEEEYGESSSSDSQEELTISEESLCSDDDAQVNTARRRKPLMRDKAAAIRAFYENEPYDLEDSDFNRKGEVITQTQQCIGKTRPRKKGARPYRCKMAVARGALCWRHLAKLEGLKYGKSSIPGAGLGLIATRVFSPEDTVTTYTGKLAIAPVKPSSKSNYQYQVSRGVTIDAAPRNTAPGRMMNDPKGSDQPANVVWVNDRVNHKARLKATRTILPGEEVLVSYGPTYWKTKERRDVKKNLVKEARKQLIAKARRRARSPSPEEHSPSPERERSPSPAEVVKKAPAASRPAVPGRPAPKKRKISAPSPILRSALKKAPVLFAKKKGVPVKVPSLSLGQRWYVPPVESEEERKSEDEESIYSELYYALAHATSVKQSSLKKELHTAPTKAVHALHADNPYRKEWKAAMDDEHKSMIDNGVYHAVAGKAVGGKLLSTKWVFKLKRDERGKPARFKARLVVRGFEQREGLDYDETFAPVMKLTSLRVFLAITNALDYDIQVADVKTAFLHADLEEGRLMYIADPFGGGAKLLQLDRALYGLKQAPRLWNQTLHDFLVNDLKFESLQFSDRCIYTRISRTQNKLIICVFVDDIPHANHRNDREEMCEVITQLGKRFSLVLLGDVKLILGIRVTRDRKKGTMYLDQEAFTTKLLEQYAHLDVRTKPTPRPTTAMVLRNPVEDPLINATSYRSIIGSLQWLVTCTRPDIAHAVGMLARSCADPQPQQFEETKYLLRYLSGTRQLGLTYRPMSNGIILYGYSDADWAGEVVGARSTSGSLLMIGGAAIYWRSGKQPTVALSSTEAEYIAASETTRTIKSARVFLAHLGWAQSESTPLYIDNQTAIRMSSEEGYDEDRRKHINVKYHYIVECVKEGYIKPVWVPTEQQLADIFTKSMPQRQFLLLRKQVMNE